ncbi:carbon-nitrogen hydrolase family protein [Fusobacterium polymorphum]
MENRKIKIALAQMRIEQKNIELNTKKILKIIEEVAKQNVDIICFPELANIGYTVKFEELQNFSETLDGNFIKLLKEKAKDLKIHILFGYLEADPIIHGHYYNSCIFINDEGKIIANSRKVYLWKKEKVKFKSGNTFQVTDTKFGKIGILVCYDLEFPEPARIEALKGAELIFVPALWSIPAKRRWDIDIAGNALFNLLFIAGCNAVGDNCCGKSKIVGPDTEIIIEASEIEEEILVSTIDLNKVQELRSKIPYLSDFKEDTFSMEAIKKY